MKPEYFEILRRIFPTGYSLVFTYGSGVFRQVGNVATQNTMIDFVLAVDDPLDWHTKNLAVNSSHYSFLQYFGPKAVANIQDGFGANIYYNTLIPTPIGLIKYGVIKTEKLISDLIDWETLYISGRLHKPVKIVYIDNNNETLKNALKINLYNAIRTSLLILPESFTEEELYMKIAGLSYSGDFRMVFGEDPNKVRNIVLGQMNEFRKLYLPYLQDLKDFVFIDFNKGTGVQNVSVSTKLFHLQMLPKRLQSEIKKEWDRDGWIQDMDDILRDAAQDPDSGDVVFNGVKRIVKKSSFTQSTKGIFTAGAMKSIEYSYYKILKMLSGL